MTVASAFYYSLLVDVPHSMAQDASGWTHWAWQNLSVFGLSGIHEGTVLTEELENSEQVGSPWVLDSGVAPQSRDWVGHQKLLHMELYFDLPDLAEQARAQIAATYPSLLVSAVQVHAREDWNANWQASFQGIELGEMWKVLPPWSEKIKQFPAQKTIVINPGSGFGTGTHETTSLCLERLAYLGSLSGKTVLDFGSGSGILSLGALKLGADWVDAVEVDALAIENAKENAALNHLTVHFHESLLERQKKYDLIIANILKPVLLEFCQELVLRLRSPGVLILSGLIEKDLQDIQASYGRALGVRSEVFQKNEWFALVFQL